MKNLRQEDLQNINFSTGNLGKLIHRKTHWGEYLLVGGFNPSGKY